MMDKGILGILVYCVVVTIVFGAMISNALGDYPVPNVVIVEQPLKWIVGEENEISVRVVTYWTNFNGTMVTTPMEGKILLVLVGDPETNMVVWEDWGVTGENGYLNYTLTIDKADVYKTVVIENIFGIQNRWGITFVVIE